MSDPRRKKVNRCFEAGMSKAADEIYNDYRLTKRNKELCLGNIGVVNICKKYDFTPSKMTSVPILIKSMVEHMIKSGALKEYIGDDDKQNKVYALGKFALSIFCLYIYSGTVKAVTAAVAAKISKGDYNPYRVAKG